jgi:topoisomerase-4 subunit A
MRLRNLRKLEEMEIRTEHDKLSKEKKELQALLKSEDRQWAAVADQIREVKKTFGPNTDLGRRRTTFGDAPEHSDEDILESMVEREPITIVVSEKGWIRALRGHVDDLTSLTFKTDDALKAAIKAETTDKIMVASTGGRFYTLAGDKLPGGRGHGEPVKLMVDMDAAEDVVAVFVHKPERKLLVVSNEGHGFIVPEAETLANTRKGKQVMTPAGGAEMRLCVEAEGDLIAMLGENRKLLIFPRVQVPEMTRGKGVRLQKYKDGGASDARVFSKADGLSWLDSSGRSFNKPMSELKEWVGERAQAGRLPPPGFTRSNKFGTPAIV